MENHPYFCHYYEKESGPFVSLSTLRDEEAQVVIDELIKEDKTLAAKTHGGQYMFYRRMIEKQVRYAFEEKGGTLRRSTPHYMTWGKCPHLTSWYKDGSCIKIPVAEFDMSTVSFTYGDTFITFDPSHGKTEEYRKNVCTYDEMIRIIEKYGWPEKSWYADAPWWQPTYVEAQIWSDIPNGYL